MTDYSDPTRPYHTDEVQRLKQEVDALQVHVMSLDKPWFKEPSSIVAALALIFSLVTTALSFARDWRLDQQADRAELRQLIQRLSTLPREELELKQKLIDQPHDMTRFLGIVANEGTMLIGQALDIMERIPKLVGASELTAVAAALVSAGRTAEARALYLQAAEHPRATAREVVPSYRQLGYYEFQLGRIEQAREHFAKAVNVFQDRFPNEDPSFVNYTHTYTQAYWASYEAAAGQCDEAQTHLEDADRRFQAAPNAFVPAMRQQIEQTRDQIEGCRRGLTPPAARPAAGPAG